jgi:hypothetical protein
MNSRIGTLLSVSMRSMLVALMIVSFAGRADAQDPKRAIEGTWFVQLTFRNCADGTALGSAFGLNTFAQGGTMLGTPSAPVAATRTGQGYWTHVAGATFQNRMALFAYNPQTGALAGVRLVTRTIDVGPGPDEFRSRDTDQLYDPVTLLPIGAQGCVTGVGRRLP